MKNEVYNYVNNVIQLLQVEELRGAYETCIHYKTEVMRLVARNGVLW